MKNNSKLIYLFFVLSIVLASCGGGVSETQSGGSTGTSTAAAAINLPKTGQIISYGTASLDDGTFQRGIGWPNPRFTSGTGGEVACVIDNLTGFMWVKTPDSTARTWQQALDYANSLVLCGHSNWRLPNRKELRSLINYGETNTATWLNSRGFSNVQTGAYWSSSTCGYNTTQAHINNMNNGIERYDAKSSNLYYTWPVRSNEQTSMAPAAAPKSGQRDCYDTAGNKLSTCSGTGQDGDYLSGVAWPSQRFVVGSGIEADCVIDNLTGLMWVKSPDSITRSWQEALNYPDVLDLCGHSDWRLPNVNELESLIHTGYTQEICGAATCSSNAAWLNTQGFNNIQGTYYWSSTTFAPGTYGAWFVNIGLPWVSYDGKLSAYYAWPVRGGR